MILLEETIRMNESKCLPLVSIIIPSFNREKTIGDTIESLINQTYSNIEIIIVDDCSTDNTAAVVKKYNDSRIVYYILDENKKACFARNYGFEKSKGEYIALMDSDDVCHPDRIFKQYQSIVETEADFVFCGMNRVERDGTKYFYPLRKIDFSKDVFEQELIENRICSVCMFMKRIVFKKTMFDISLKRYQDWDFALRVCRYFNVAYLDEALVDSTIQNDSITNIISNYDSLLAIYSKYKSDIEKVDIVYSEFHRKLGDCIRSSDFKKARKHFGYSLKRHFALKTFIKYLLTCFHVRY